MFGKCRTLFVVAVAAFALAILGAWYASRPGQLSRPETTTPAEDKLPAPTNQLQSRFVTEVRPFVERYCFECHGGNEPKADLDLSRDQTMKQIAGNMRQWAQVLERLQGNEMPPEDAGRQPSSAERAVVVAWLRELRESESSKSSGRRTPMLARRLSNAEYDYTIRDLTGVDIRPARTFPVDPANEAGFDNSGESLTMTPVLLKKYFAAAKLVSAHMVLAPDGFVFAPHPVVTDTAG
jgi:hypothetical protein